MDEPRRLRPGLLQVVGLGPGSPGLLSPDAASAIDSAEVIVGYRGYLDLISDRLGGKTLVGRELGEEVERAGLAIDQAESGRTVALVSSGDAGVYGMAGVAWELAVRRGSPVEIVVVPGVTAALAASARLGAPLAHDWCCISLSDLLTPWDLIARRVEAAARADFVLVLYNPRSRTRTWQLPAVAQLLLAARDPATPVGLVENAYRPGERVELVRLDALASSDVSMFTTVVVGSSRTFVSRGRMITPRIYEAKAGTPPSPSLPDPPLPLGEGRGEGSPPGPNTPGSRIMADSLALIDRELGPHPSDPDERSVVRRMIHASADFDFAANARFSPGAIASAVAAFRRGAPIVADVEMLRSGIRRDLAGPLGVEAICDLNDPAAESLASAEGLTRSAAGMRLACRRVGDGAVVAVGNAPTALDEALRLVREEGWRPACIIGIPVGFVGVEESKRRLIDHGEVPYLTSLGRKGGTAVTAAAINALLELAGRQGR
jgi:precorrin-3B C17-methyltransferase